MRASYRDDKYIDALNTVKRELETCDAVVCGAGAGLSTSAGFTYAGERFDRYFSDFAEKYGFSDMYSGGFCDFDSMEEFWAFWSRNIYVNRYMDPPRPVYKDLMDLIKDKEYFVITTNVDHCFQKAGIDKERLFYTQGDYGLFQSADPGINKTYDNIEWVTEAVKAQGFTIADDGTLTLPEDGKLNMRVPSEMFPKCPDGGDVALNLRTDESFVEDEGWQAAAGRYSEFLDRHENDHVVYLEMGVGNNTPVIIKYPFWRMTAANPNAAYVCLSHGNAFCPEQIAARSVMIKCDIGDVFEDLKGLE